MLRVSSIKNFYHRYESRIGIVALLVGFVFDNLTLREASISAQTAVFLIYLILSGIAIIALNFIDEREKASRHPKWHFWSFVLLQFALGSLFSMFFVFYSRGVSISTSWPFLFLLFANMVGSELFKKEYSRLGAQIPLFFIAIFSFSIYFLPVISHSMGDREFILSGFISLALAFAFVRIVAKVAKYRVAEDSRQIVCGVFAIYLIMSAFYFFNIIPPVPLVMKKGGVYHSLDFTYPTYSALKEEKPWWGFLTPYPTYHHSPGELMYVLTAVYAPANLRATIVHDWQYFDEINARWVSSTKIPVAISGGREEGYRSYSVKRSVFPGLWRVDIKTSDGRIVGRVRFKIVEGGGYNLLEDRI